MSPHLQRTAKAGWAVSTWVRSASVWTRTWHFHSSVVLNCIIQKQHWYGLLLLCTQCPCVSLAETFGTQWTMVWLVSYVDSHVTIQMSGLCKHVATHATLVRFLWLLWPIVFDVNDNWLQKRLSHSVVSTRIIVVFSMSTCMLRQAVLPSKLLMTQSTQIRPCLSLILLPSVYLHCTPCTFTLVVWVEITTNSSVLQYNMNGACLNEQQNIFWSTQLLLCLSLQSTG